MKKKNHLIIINQFKRIKLWKKVPMFRTGLNQLLQKEFINLFIVLILVYFKMHIS